MDDPWPGHGLAGSIEGDLSKSVGVGGGEGERTGGRPRGNGTIGEIRAGDCCAFTKVGVPNKTKTVAAKIAGTFHARELPMTCLPLACLA